MSAYPNTRYTVIDGENLDDRGLDVQSQVVLHDTREGGKSQVVATFQNYGDAAMFAVMKNNAPKVKSEYTTLPGGTAQGHLVIVRTGEIVAKFHGADCEDELINWLMREYPLIAALRNF